MLNLRGGPPGAYLPPRRASPRRDKVFLAKLAGLQRPGRNGGGQDPAADSPVPRQLET